MSFIFDNIPFFELPIFLFYFFTFYATLMHADQTLFVRYQYFIYPISNVLFNFTASRSTTTAGVLL